MRLVVILRDRAEAIDVRRARLDDHLAWLDRHRDRILVAGSLRRTPPNNPIGGLWIVEADSVDEVERLIESDPFTTAGHEVRHWGLAFPGRRIGV